MTAVDAIRAVTVITTGKGEVHHEHVHGTRKPELVWIFFGRRWVRLPSNVYVVDHADGLVLFDTGQDRAVVTDPDYYPDRITAFFDRHVFRNIRIGPEDTLPSSSSVPVTRPRRWTGRSSRTCTPIMSVASPPSPRQICMPARRGSPTSRRPDHPERATVFRHRIEIAGARWRMILFQSTNDPALAPFTEAFDVIGDGSMVVLPTPGHLPGSVSMLVRRPFAAPLLLVGGLTYDERLLERDQIPALCDDPEQLLASYAKVRALREHTPDLVILAAHDPNAAEKLSSRSRTQPPRAAPHEVL